MQQSYKTPSLFLFLLLISCQNKPYDYHKVLELMPKPPINQFDRDTESKINESYSEIKNQINEDHINPIYLSSQIAKLAKLYFINNLYAESSKTFNIALEFQPKQFSWVYINAVSFQHQGQFDKAIPLLLTAKKLKSNNIPTMLRLANIYRLLNKSKLALNEVKSILKIDKNHSAALYIKSEILIDIEKPKEALTILNPLIEKNPRANKIYYLLINAHRMLNNIQKVEFYLQKVGDKALISPDPILENLQKLVVGAGSHILLANRAHKNGDLLTARTHLLTALEYEENNVTALHNLGYISGIQNQHTEAVSYLKKAYVLEPNNLDIAIDYSTALIATMEYSEAKLIYLNILKSQPNHEITKGRLKKLNHFMLK